jgi:hypothetical protein
VLTRVRCASVTKAIRVREGTRPVCGRLRTVWYTVVMSGGVEVRRNMTKRRCPNLRAHEMARGPRLIGVSHLRIHIGLEIQQDGSAHSRS